MAPLRASRAGRCRRQAGADADQPHDAQRALRSRPQERGGGGGVPRRARRAGRRHPHLGRRRRLHGRARALRDLLPGLYPQAMGHGPVRARQVGHRARADPHQHRRSLFHRHASRRCRWRAIRGCSSGCSTIPISTCCSASTTRRRASAYPHDHLVFTGPIDEYFGHRYGKLPYRSLRFRHETRAIASGSSRWRWSTTRRKTVPYTRITEYKHLTGQQAPRTSITYEYPSAEGDPYYPIPREENQALFKRYEALAIAQGGRHLRRPACHLSLLQHGPGRRTGAVGIPAARREARGQDARGRGDDGDALVGCPAPPASAGATARSRLSPPPRIIRTTWPHDPYVSTFARRGP